MTFRKAEYITDFAEKVHTGVFSLDAVAHMDDEDAIRALSSLKGIGVWTAEMILLFCLQRPDIFSYDDLAIQRGLRMVYHHREIDRRLFEKISPPLSPVLQRGQPVSVGGRGRRNSGNEGLQAEKQKRKIKRGVQNGLHDGICFSARRDHAGL